MRKEKLINKNVTVVPSKWTCSNTAKLEGKTGVCVNHYIGDKMVDVSINSRVHTMHISEIKKSN